MIFFLSLLALLVGIVRSTAQQPTIIHATIPFDCWIESSHLPAGIYQIEDLKSTAYLLFRSTDGKVVKDVYALPQDETPAKEADAKLVFKIENGKYDLYEGWGPNGRRVVTMEAAKPEPSGDARCEVRLIYH